MLNDFVFILTVIFCHAKGSQFLQQVKMIYFFFSLCLCTSLKLKGPGLVEISLVFYN